MAKKRFRCGHCRKIRTVRVKGQTYCGEEECRKNN